MPAPIRIKVRRRTQTPNKNNIVHPYRTSYFTVMVIDYDESCLIFKKIDGRGIIETEAQFAKFLYDRLGEGEYSCLAWKKKRVGFWSFLRIYCFKDGRWKRIEKKITQEEKELKELKTEVNRAKVLLSQATTEEEKEEIRRNEGDKIEEYDFMKEIKKIDDDIVKRGPSGYLKAAMPLYREYEYENYYNTTNDNLINTSGESWL